MVPIVNKHYIDDLPLQKFDAISKIDKVLSFVDKENKKPMIKTASVDQNTLINLFTQMLSVLNLKVSDGDVKNVLNNLSSNIDPDDMNKTSAIKKNSKEKREEIKIVSKNIKDSHYQVDISKDMVVKNGKKIFMVSCYARDAYLGRYLIKRNYYFTQDREESADNAYDEISLKMASLKDRYYNDIIDVSGIFSQIKTTLDGVISEIKSEEDKISTNVSR